MPRRPLAGIKVIELARILAGPWCGQLLADLGAEVIKIERPGSGDDTRRWGPPFLTGRNGEPLGAAYFHAANRGKTSLAIDITSPEGQEEIRHLVRGADVVIENYKVGGLRKYGLDHAGLSKDQPGLVTCSITGFGQTGPYAHRAGYDFIAQGMGGFMSINGEPDREPQKAGIAYADIFTGVYAAVAILSALRERDVSGVGAHIDMALLDTQVGVLANQALNWMTSGEVPSRMGNGHSNVVPYQAFHASDGELIIAVGNDRQFADLCQLLDLNIAGDARYSTNAARVAHRGELIALLAIAIAPWRKAELAWALEEKGIPAGPINSIAEACADPQVVHRGMQLDLGGIPGLASPIMIDGQRMVSDKPSPPLAD
jgi:crotonobetainyl-CoA:carnitine CoA-transferase CaiB-like acyl-CoA transferase